MSPLHYYCSALALPSIRPTQISISQHQHCSALALLSISIAQHQHCSAWLQPVLWICIKYFQFFLASTTFARHLDTFPCSLGLNRIFSFVYILSIDFDLFLIFTADISTLSYIRQVYSVRINSSAGLLCSFGGVQSPLSLG